MAQVINTNSLSLMTQNNLNTSQSALNTAIQRLSSGLRINSAKDDAAGQAIANRFTANIRGLTQAQRNANDGISLAQTTEGALTEVNNNLQRIRELSVQASNGSNSPSDLQSIQDEIAQRLQEIDRISEQTDFNGVKVLSSTTKDLTIQVGANDGETITIDLEEISAKTLGLEGFNISGKGIENKAATESDLISLSGGVGTTLASGVKQFTVNTAHAAATKADLFGKLKAGDTAQIGTTTYTYNAAAGNFTYNGTVAGGDAATRATNLAAALTPASGSRTATVTIGGGSQDVIINTNGSMVAADDGAALYLDNTGNLTKNRTALGDPLATATNVAQAIVNGGAGNTIAVQGGPTYTSAAGNTVNVTGLTISKEDLSAAFVSTAGTMTLGTTTYDVDTGPTPTIEEGGAAVYIDPANGNLTTTDETPTNYFVQKDGKVTTAEGTAVYVNGETNKLTTEATRDGTATADPLKALDAALAKVDTLRSSLGAVQNRLDSTIANLGTTVNNLSSSRSRIQDADYATEVSNMTRAQILQQAGTSVLAQANQTTQNVLSLLR